MKGKEADGRIIAPRGPFRDHGRGPRGDLGTCKGLGMDSPAGGVDLGSSGADPGSGSPGGGADVDPDSPGSSGADVDPDPDSL